MTSPFDWKGKPSIFASDKHFTGVAGGKTRSQLGTESVEKVFAKGINHATIHGISKNYDAHAAAREFHHRREANKDLGRSAPMEPFSENDPDPFREARQAIAKIRARRK